MKQERLNIVCHQPKPTDALLHDVQVVIMGQYRKHDNNLLHMKNYGTFVKYENVHLHHSETVNPTELSLLANADLA